MNYSDLSSKLTQVIEQIPKDVLYDFCCSYAQELPFRKRNKCIHFFQPVAKSEHVQSIRTVKSVS